MRDAARAWLIAAAAALAASACGQKGPLYLPDKGGKVVTRAPGATTAPPAPQSSPQGPSGTATPATPKKDDSENDPNAPK